MSAYSKGPTSIGLHGPQPEQQQDGLLQPLVDDHLVGDRVDLGHPGLAGVEQVDGLGHHGQGVGVARTQLRRTGPQLVDLGLEICHGADVSAGSRRPCPGRAAPTGTGRAAFGPGSGSVTRSGRHRVPTGQPLGHQLEAVHGLDHGHPDVTRPPRAVEVAGADQQAAVHGQGLGQAHAPAAPSPANRSGTGTHR